MMTHERDKPTYYNIVGETSGTVFATAPASTVRKRCKELQAQYNGEKLKIVLVEE